MLAYEMQMFSNKLDAEKVLSFSYDYYHMTFPFTTIPGRFTGDNLPSILCASIPVPIQQSTFWCAIIACRQIYEKSIRIWTGPKYISCSCESALITWLSSGERSRVPLIFLYGAYQHLLGNPGRAAFQVPSSLRIWCRGILACPRRCPVMSRYFSKDQNWQSALAYFLLTTKMGEGRVIRSLTPPPRTPAFLNDDDTFNQELI